MSENKSNSNGISFPGLLTILFICLKLTGYIDWSWWWVLSPLWGGLALAIVLIVIAMVIRLLLVVFARIRRKILFARHLQKFKK